MGLAVISNAFLIAFTSDFIQKLVYKFHYGEVGTMAGYMNFTLSRAPNEHWVDEGLPDCFYRGFRDHEGNLTPVHWYIFALRLLFDIKIKREKFLAKRALQDMVEARPAKEKESSKG